eukprot:CAMPEP_0179063788 /NCGR_PEP_ID=MMETSP0796-20121207/27618_1 /TAXON_ID=73915 /ORGANISM="Pyrodinium bahamense, Strain pbaha01" /LENGTH=315 /DNA_ID=CAMNT_0020760725 /DNA_START=185 /DNA_END=1132 /DNA_ORIENTATION=+
MERFAPAWQGTCPLCREAISMYILKDAEGSKLAKASVTTIFGLIFAQFDRLGYASYHFDSPEDCYISYERADPSWTTDDGSPLPGKKPFRDVSYDGDTRTFRGAVNWETLCDGQACWEYELTFSEDFSAIVAGEHRGLGSEGQLLSRGAFRAPWEMDRGALSYVRWTSPPSNIFGSVFVQGLAYSSFLEGIASYHFDAADDCYISYANAPSEWLLDDGSAPPLKKPFQQTSYVEETRTLRGVIEWEPAFGGSTRWEYEMHFAKDFSRVVSGSMQSFTTSGERSVMPFRDPADEEEVLGENLYYSRKATVLMAVPQ